MLMSSILFERKERRKEKEEGGFTTFQAINSRYAKEIWKQAQPKTFLSVHFQKFYESFKVVGSGAHLEKAEKRDYEIAKCFNFYFILKIPSQLAVSPEPINKTQMTLMNNDV